MQENQNNNNLSSPSFETNGAQPETPAFLQREEVRTMAKDIAGIREQETRQEQERIAQLQKESSAVREPTNPPTPLTPPTIPANTDAMPPEIQQRRPGGGSDKLIVRMIAGGIVLFFVLNLGVLGFWYFTSKDREPSVVIVPKTKENIAPEPQ